MTTRGTSSAAHVEHPFGELLRQFRSRKAGLSQTRLAELSGYDQAILVRMSQGKKDLTGPSGRERVVRLVDTLADQGVLSTLEEANALLLAAGMPPLFERHPGEAKLMSRLVRTSSQPGHQVRRTNLPAPLSNFIGREHEVTEVRRLLSSTRLLTLTGPGGVGKTRLAQRVAADVLVNYADGVWYAELATLTDSAHVAEAVAPAFGLKVGVHSAQDQVIDYLRDRDALLVLDNCEHLINAMVAFVIGLLHACPRVTILATSRESLNVEGETAWRVPPMQLDEAAILFATRATAVRPGLNLDTNDPVVAHICQRLDGMPLAIELAAPRLSGMNLADLATRIDDRFALLTGGRRGALPRHQTLQATMDWSYDLLSEPERVLFRRLSIFTGGWTAELAEQVCADAAGSLPLPPGVRGEGDVLPLLLQLVSKSLVAVEEDTAQGAGETRYRFLETIREYAWQKLAEYGEVETMQLRHAEALAVLAEQFRTQSHGLGQSWWMARIEHDFPNLHAVMAWSFGPQGDPLFGCRIFSSLQVVWYAGTHATDAQRWSCQARSAITDEMPALVLGGVWLVSTTLDLTGLTPQELLAGYKRALGYYTAAGDQSGMADATMNVSAFILVLNPRDPTGWRMLEESVALARAAGDAVIEHCALKGMGEWAKIWKEFDRAEVLFRQNMQLCRETGDSANLAWILLDLAHLYMERLQFHEALPYAQEAGEVARSINDFQRELFGECYVAEIVRYLGNLPRALEINEACLALARDKLTPLDQLLPILTLSKALNDAGQHTRAQALLDDWMRILYQNVGLKAYHFWYGATFDALACVASGCADAARAARLFGAADEIFTVSGERRWLNNDWEYAPYRDKARVALGDAAFEAALAEGRSMTPEQAVAYALGREL